MAPTSLETAEIPCLAGTPEQRPTLEAFAARRAAARRAKALERLADAVEQANSLEIPPPVEQVAPECGRPLLLPAEAYELARQVYYHQHGTITACASAVIAAGLSDTPDIEQVRGRLRTWWTRQHWPKHPPRVTFAIRDANFDGGLYRSERLCVGEATGNGRAPKGKKCQQSALPDSDYCAHHDPRPEYVEARSKHAARLASHRAFDLVEIEPLRRWMDVERQRLLAQARTAGRAHPNNNGWCLLARAMGVDQSLIKRMMCGTHNGAAGRAGRAQTKLIRAATVVRYLESSSVSFRDLYGFDPPRRSGPGPFVCPLCGEPKGCQAQVCRACYEGRGSRCSYINRRGKRCPQNTTHPSGVCAKCRTVTERVRKPRNQRPSNLTPAMLILAIGEYRDLPDFPRLARRMWEANAAGVRETYKTRKTLKESLIGHFRRNGWTDPADAERAHAQLVAEHGETTWPGQQQPAPEHAAIILYAPFGRWLQIRHEDLGSYTALAARIQIHHSTLSKWLRGVPPKRTVRRLTVERALAAWGEDTTLNDLYAKEHQR